MQLPPPAEFSPRFAHLLRLGIVAATVVGLARATQVSLGPLLASGVSPGAIVLRAERAPALTTDPPPEELWIAHLVVDGRLVRGESVGVSDVTRGAGDGADYPQGVRLVGSSDSGAVSFNGGRILMEVAPGAWRGRLRVERDGRETQAVDLPSTNAAANGPVIVEDPIAPESTLLFLGALVLLTAAAWRLAPVASGRAVTPWLLGSLAVLHLLFWLSHVVATTSDSPGYLADSSQIVNGVPAYFPPGYPMLLGAVGSIAGRSLGALVTLLQHGMGVLAGLWVYQLLRRIVALELALIGGLLAGALPPVLAMSQAVLTEVPTLTAMVGAVYFAVRSAETGRVGFALLSGLLAGWAGVLRVVPLVGLLPAMVLIHVMRGVPRRIRQLGLASGTAAAILLLPMSWFWYHSGKATLANSSGLHLYNRVVNEQGLVDETGPATRDLLARLGGEDPRHFTHWTIRELPGMTGLKYREAERLLQRVSIEGIRKHTWEYVAYTPALAWRELRAKPSGPAWARTSVAEERLESRMPLAPNAAALRWRWRMDAITGTVWPILCWTAVAGILLGLLTPHRLLVLALVVAPSGYLLATASVERFNQRHSLVTLPFVVALSLMVPAFLLLVARRSGPRPVPEPAR